ncbi:MAG: GNAT family N-acetyltransferase [Planctomycetota bacterium]|nr:GNAT family N-acetyltransferase [Planctomycetota bacterium]
MRQRLYVSLSATTATVDPGARRPVPADRQDLADLMLAAYRGTIDDSGETIDDARAEIDRLFAGEYGEFLPDCSEIIERDGKLVSATLVTRYQGKPLLAFSFTAPHWQRCGLARAGMLRAMDRLCGQGETELGLVVTSGNKPAEALYASLGFRAHPGQAYP